MISADIPRGWILICRILLTGAKKKRDDTVPNIAKLLLKKRPTQCPISRNMINEKIRIYTVPYGPLHILYFFDCKTMILLTLLVPKPLSWSESRQGTTTAGETAASTKPSMKDQSQGRPASQCDTRPTTQASVRQGRKASLNTAGMSTLHTRNDVGIA
jgi:hypothetical protein